MSTSPTGTHLRHNCNVSTVLYQFTFIEVPHVHINQLYTVSELSINWLSMSWVKIILRLQANHTTIQGRKVFDAIKLASPETKKAFSIKLKNRFSLLVDTEEDQCTVKSSWNNIKNIYTERAKKVIGFRKTSDRSNSMRENWPSTGRV